MMPTRNWLAPLVGAGFLFGAQVASAQSHSGVDAQVYKPALGGAGLLSIESAQMATPKDFSFQLQFSYGSQPLTLPVPGIGTAADGDSVLEYALGMHFTLGFQVSEKLFVGADAGLFRTSTDAGYGERGRFDTSQPGSIRIPSTGLISTRPLSNIDPAGGPDGRSGPVDPRIGVKYQLLKMNKLAVAAQLSMSVPFGDDEMFLGDRSFVFEPRIAVDYALLGGLRLSANAGARLRKRTVLEATDTVLSDARAVLDVGSEALLGGGLVYAVMPRLQLAAEAMFFLPLPAGMSWGDCELASGDDCDTVDEAFMDSTGTMQNSRYYADADYGDAAGYALGGILFQLTSDVSMAVSAGAGIAGDRKDDLRMVGGLRWQPTPEGEVRLGRGDRDSDGVSDLADVCPDEPEDKDNFQDDDGCPELDNDGDNFNDADDSCPNEPEDRDGYQDEDGCPERDNDGDGIDDVSDRCPMDKEDIDNFEDSDGCPDNDNDGDGIEDAKDQCPIQPETVNGLDDTDGCPDQIQRTGPIYRAEQGIIDLQGKRINFRGRSATFSKGVRAILDLVAGEITTNDLVVRIEVHTARGTRSSNPRVVKRVQAQDKRLSQQRADAVMRYLRSKGVTSQQVNQAVGLGSSRPLNNFAEYDKNQNRVDFSVVRQVQR